MLGGRCLTGVEVLFSLSVSKAEYPQREVVYLQPGLPGAIAVSRARHNGDR